MMPDAFQQPGAFGLSNVTIIGAGIVGAATALTLARAGHKVTIVDKGAPGGGTSHGNAGGIVPGVCPLGTPAALRGAPAQLMDPDSALAVRWRELPRLIPWFARLIAQSTPARVEANSIAFSALTAAAPEAWRKLVKGSRAEELLRPRGWLKVYDTDNGFAATADLRAMQERRGINCDILDRDGLRQYEPALSDRFTRGILLTDGLFCINPRRMAETLVAEALDRGAEFIQAAVSDIERTEAGPRMLLSDGRRIASDKLVLAAGALSNRLSKRVGSDVPLQAERGYHVMFDTPPEQTNGPVVWGERNVVICPMETGLRLTSIAEFASPEAPPDYARIERLSHLAGEMLPALGDTQPRERWMGCRPSLPDSLPVIGPSDGDPNVILAFGHNHYGLTLSAITAQLVGSLVEGAEPSLSLLPYRAAR